MFPLVTRSAVWITIGVLLLPVGAGVVGTLLPALGYLPAAGLTGLSFDPIANLAATPGLATAVLLAASTGLISSALALLIAMLTVGLFLDRPAFRVVRRLLSPILSVPHAAAALGIAALIAPSGLLFRVLSSAVTGWDRPPDLLIVGDRMGLALTLGLVVKETPFLVLMLIAALPQVDASRRLLAAQSLGYGRLKAFFVAIAPLLYRQVRLAVFAVLAYGASNVDMAMILGPTNPPTLAVLGLRLATDPDLAHRTTAAAAAILLILVCLVLLAVWLVAERLLGGLAVRFAASGGRCQADGAARAAGAVLALASPVAIMGGFLVLLLWSVSGPWPFPHPLPASITPMTWMRTVPTLLEPAGWTIALALVSALLAVCLCALVLERETQTGRRPGLAALVVLFAPLLVPQIAFLFGLSSLAVGLRIDGLFVSVLLAHLVFVLPFTYLSLVGAWRAFDDRYALAALGLGRGQGAVFLSVKLPMLFRAVCTAIAVGFSVSVAQYLPTLLIGAGRITSVTTEAIALSAGQDRRVIGVVALVQALLPALAFGAALALPAMLFRNRRGMAAGGA